MAKSRRDFLKSTGCVLSMAALAGSVERFGKRAAFAQKAENSPSDFTDYKALVCISLTGGNDGNNMFVPIHNDASVSNYAAYRAVRGTTDSRCPEARLMVQGHF